MTNDEKRIRIAEACGYKWWPSPHNPEQSILAKSQEDANSVNVGLNAHHLAPDYFGNRVAMAIAITTIPQEKRSLFVSRLADVLIEAGVRNLSAIDYIAAEPEHLAEAFGRTLELW